MGIEIEGKFLVNKSKWQEAKDYSGYRQGYLMTDPNKTIRARQTSDKVF